MATVFEPEITPLLFGSPIPATELQDFWMFFFFFYDFQVVKVVNVKGVLKK